MIRARFSCAVVLLAGMACTTTPSAPETASPGGPDPEAGSAAFATDPEAGADPSAVLVGAGVHSGADSGDDEGDTAHQLAPGVSVAELADDVLDRIERVVAVSRRTLGEVDASFESARLHAADVFARLAQLRGVLEQGGFSGSALAELDKLEQDAVALNQTSEALRDDLRDEQIALEGLTVRIEEVINQVQVQVEEESGSAEAADETLPRTQLRDLDAEASAYERSGVLENLVSRSDALVSRVAVLVSQLDRVDRELAVIVDTGIMADGVAQADTRSSAPGAATRSAKALADQEEDEEEEPDDTQTPKGEIAEITTNKGTLLVQFFPDVAPAHVQNFKRLVRNGFYDGLTFHRVLPGYIIQGGCPRGDGLGGPGWQLDNEFNRRPHRRGTLSMARFAHPDSAGSQFFICLDDRPELNEKQTVFGRVISGDATLAAIEALADPNGTGTPTEDILIQRVVLRPWRLGDNETSMIAGNPVR